MRNLRRLVRNVQRRRGLGLLRKPSGRWRRHGILTHRVLPGPWRRGLRMVMLLLLHLLLLEGHRLEIRRGRVATLQLALRLGETLIMERGNRRRPAPVHDMCTVSIAGSGRAVVEVSTHARSLHTLIFMGGGDGDGDHVVVEVDAAPN